MFTIFINFSEYLTISIMAYHAIMYFYITAGSVIFSQWLIDYDSSYLGQVFCLFDTGLVIFAYSHMWVVL